MGFRKLDDVSVGDPPELGWMEFSACWSPTRISSFSSLTMVPCVVSM